MPNILTIDYQSNSLGTQFTTSLKNTGFAVLKNHPISKDLISDIYDEWKFFFDSNYKHSYLFDKIKQDGYFPYLSEHAKGSSIKDLKEFYHIYSWGRYPSQISEKTNNLIKQFKNIAEKLLFEINQNSPEKIKNNFSIPLHNMIQNSGQNLLRIIHYPPLLGSEDSQAIRAAAHEDINLITLLVGAEESGLEVQNPNGDWIPIAAKSQSIVCNIGDMMQLVTRSNLKSTSHRVIDTNVESSVSRYSMPFFLHPSPEIELCSIVDDSPESISAHDFLEERLRAIKLY